MIFQFEASRLDGLDVPAFWSKYIDAGPGQLEITGDRTGYRELYLYSGATSGAVATSLGELLDHLRSTGEQIELSPFGISSLLHHALVPLPHTVYEGIQFLSMGDSARIDVRGGVLHLEMAFDYPWTVGRSRNDGIPSEETLLQLLTCSTERQMEEFGNEGFLMLSSGKDSPAVALALAEGGFRDIPCVTYSTGPDDPEPPIAADICRRLGLDHEIVEMPTDHEIVAQGLLQFFEASPAPGTDLSQVPYVFAVQAAGPRRGAVIDGGGNDSYMGNPVSGNYLTKLRFRIRSRHLANLIKRVVPVDSPLNYLARSRAEVALPGRTLRLTDTRELYPSVQNTSNFWYDVSREIRHLDNIDFFGHTQQRHSGPAGSMQKQRLAANGIGMASSLPWCDDDVADYYFDLPERYRYDRKARKNKILLRSMLSRYLDYDANAIGKHYFEFNGAGFIQSNEEFVRSEIEECALWSEEGRAVVFGWLDDIGSRPLLYHALITVFMVSGWHNHSQFLTEGRVDTDVSGGAP